MKFKLPLTAAELSELCQKLTPLTTDITYESGTLHIEPIKADKPEHDQEIQGEITDIVIPYIQIVNELPDWGALTRAHGKPQRAGAR